MSPIRTSTLLATPILMASCGAIGRQHARLVRRHGVLEYLAAANVREVLAAITKATVAR